MMQTREPRKRVNWIFVVVLIITVPLLIFTLFMMNTMPRNPAVTSEVDTVSTSAGSNNTAIPDTTKAKQDSTLRTQ